MATAIRTVAKSKDPRHRLSDVTAPTLVLHLRNCVNVDIGHAGHLAGLPHARPRTTTGTDALW